MQGHLGGGHVSIGGERDHLHCFYRHYGIDFWWAAAEAEATDFLCVVHSVFLAAAGTKTEPAIRFNLGQR